MTPEAKQKLKSLLYQHEGYSQFPYTCTAGKLTIGIGRNLEDKGISLPEAYYMLDEDILYFSSKLHYHLPFFGSLSENRQIALIDMCFMGLQSFLGFKKTIAALEAEDWERAAEEMLKSKWAEQVGDRAIRLANIIRTDKI